MAVGVTSVAATAEAGPGGTALLEGPRRPLPSHTVEGSGADVVGETTAEVADGVADGSVAQTTGHVASDVDPASEAVDRFCENSRRRWGEFEARWTSRSE